MKNGHFHIPDGALSKESDFITCGDRLRILSLYLLLFLYAGILTFLRFFLTDDLISKLNDAEKIHRVHKIMEIVNSFYFFLAFAPIVNILLIQFIGRYLLSGAFYPY